MSLGRAFMKKKTPALQAMKLIALRNYTFVCYLAVTLSIEDLLSVES